MVALNPNGVPRWNKDASAGGELPASAFSEEVAQMAPENRRILDRTAGPVIEYAAYGVLLHALLWFLTPLAEFGLAQCPGDERAGIVQAPNDILTLVGYLVFFAPLHLYCQWKCMQNVIIPQLEVTHRFTFLGMPVYRWKYHTWFVLFSALTCGATLNTLTNGQILGRTVATYACGKPYAELEGTWRRIMETSFIHQIPGFHHSSFLRLSLFAYAIQLVTPLFAWIYARPQEQGQVNYLLSHSAVTPYRTIYSRRVPTTHGAVLMVLSSLARFEAVTFQDVTYATQRMDESHAEAGWETNCLRIGHTELDRAIARFAIIGLLQDALQTNLQTTVVGMDWYLAAKGGGLDLQMFVSVVLCFGSTIGDLMDAFDVHKIVVEVYRLFPQGHTARLSDGDRKSLRFFKRKLWRFSFYLLFFVGASVWSFAKLVALFACDRHLWNFHPYQLLLGHSFVGGCA